MHCQASTPSQRAPPPPKGSPRTFAHPSTPSAKTGVAAERTPSPPSDESNQLLLVSIMRLRKYIERLEDCIHLLERDANPSLPSLPEVKECKKRTKTHLKEEAKAAVAKGESLPPHPASVFPTLHSLHQTTLCLKCRGTDHAFSECPANICTKCNAKGHLSFSCPQKDSGNDGTPSSIPPLIPTAPAVALPWRPQPFLITGPFSSVVRSIPPKGC